MDAGAAPPVSGAIAPSLLAADAVDPAVEASLAPELPVLDAAAVSNLLARLGASVGQFLENGLEAMLGDAAPLLASRLLPANADGSPAQPARAEENHAVQADLGATLGVSALAVTLIQLRDRLLTAARQLGQGRDPHRPLSHRSRSFSRWRVCRISPSRFASPRPRRSRASDPSPRPAGPRSPSFRG
jgi:hypothetical protein